MVSILSGLNFNLYLDNEWAKPKDMAVISFLPKPCTKPSACSNSHNYGAINSFSHLRSDAPHQFGHFGVVDAVQVQLALDALA